MNSQYQNNSSTKKTWWYTVFT